MLEGVRGKGVSGIKKGIYRNERGGGEFGLDRY